MNTTDLIFPAIWFRDDNLGVEDSPTDLCTCTRVGLKRGFYRGLLVVDATGIAIRVKDARFVHGVGPFGGWNIYLNRKILVDLSLEAESALLSVADVKRLVYKSFRKWSGWQEEEDPKSLRNRVKQAQTVLAVIDAFRHW